MSVRKQLKNIKTFLVDCDGVIWINNSVIKNSNEALNNLRKLGYNVCFVTNTSQKNSTEILKKLHDLKFEACQDEIFCPSYVISHHLKNLNFQKSVYVIGSRSLITELKLLGIQGYDNDDLNEIESNLNYKIEIGAVIIGYDSQINKSKIRRAITYLICPQVLYFSTSVHYGSYHSDPPIFSVGTTVKRINRDCLRMPQVFGKPSTIMWEFIKERLNLDPETTCIVGDKLVIKLSSVTTDIAFGKRHNLTTILTMSGDTTPSDLKVWNEFYQSNHEFYRKNHAIPDHIVPTISDLVEQLAS